MVDTIMAPDLQTLERGRSGALMGWTNYMSGISMTAPMPPSTKLFFHSSRNRRMALSPVQWLGATFLTPRAFNRLVTVRISASVLPPRWKPPIRR